MDLCICFLPLLEEISSLSGVVDCMLVILGFMFHIHLRVSAYYLNLGYLIQVGFFLVPSFPCKFKGVNIIIIIIIIFTSEQYSIVEMDRMFFIQSLVEGHLGFFQVLVIANNGTMKMVEQMPLCSD